MDFLVHAPPLALAGWKVLLVDDEPEVHEVTRLVLGNFRFEDRPLDILSAMSAEEAKEQRA
jgi:CheY-like chemotaxis protein